MCVSRPRTRTVLVLDDEAAVLNVTARILRHGGLEALEASNPAEAARAVDRHPGVIDLLLVDAALPPAGGVRAAAALRARLPGLRVLFFSGYSREHLLEAGLLPPDAPFLAKPFRVESLVRKVREV